MAPMKSRSMKAMKVADDGSPKTASPKKARAMKAMKAADVPQGPCSSLVARHVHVMTSADSCFTSDT